jgi:L-alanine-DL-glutamate epimerase-like enolase superfamily enzyme
MAVTSLSFEKFELENQVPLVISRGTRTKCWAIWVRLTCEEIEGWGEAGEFGLGDVAQRLPQLEAGLTVAEPIVSRRHPLDRAALERDLRAAHVPSALITAIDQALWDWCGKRAALPVWKLWGLNLDWLPLTFVTIGIGEPETVQRRVAEWLKVGDVRAFKIKLGAPAGIAADQRMFEAVREAIPPGTLLSVDANGGWSLENAQLMSHWLAARGVDHLEQPLPRGAEANLPALKSGSPLPIILDESIFTSADLARLLTIGGFDGVNLKLLKCGGVTEAQRIIATARAHGLKTMIGCYYHSSLGNTAAASLGPMLDYLDLDSHLNLKFDPFVGAELVEGRLVPPDHPGFGVRVR